MALLLLVRHGHSTANADAVLAGWSEGVSLTDRGREDVAGLARRIAEAKLDIARIVTSPLQRCLETSELLLPGSSAEVVEDLGECHYGAWTGRPIADLTGEPLWRTVQDDPAAARFPESDRYRAESLAEMSQRVVSAIERIDEEVTAEHGENAIWVAVSHGDPIKSVIAESIGAGLAGLQRVHVEPASVSMIRRVGPRPMVLATNSAGEAIRPGLAVVAATPDVPKGDATVGGGTG